VYDRAPFPVYYAALGSMCIRVIYWSHMVAIRLGIWHD